MHPSPEEDGLERLALLEFCIRTTEITEYDYSRSGRIQRFTVRPVAAVFLFSDQSVCPILWMDGSIGDGGGGGS